MTHRSMFIVFLSSLLIALVAGLPAPAFAQEDLTAERYEALSRALGVSGTPREKVTVPFSGFVYLAGDKNREDAGGAARIGGVLRFDAPSLGVAGVGASAPGNDVIFPARRQEGGINTGAAIRNLGENPIEVSCQLMKAGAVLETKDIPLAGNGQTAKFIHELFTQTDTSDFAGSVRCTAPEGERFTGVVLEMDADSRIFTTLPVIPVPTSY